MSRAGSKRAKSKPRPKAKPKQAPARKSAAPALTFMRPRQRKPFLQPALETVSPAIVKAIEKGARQAAQKAVEKFDAGALGEPWSTSRISPGRWKMRGGSIAVVTGPCTIKYGAGMALRWYGWKGHLADHPKGEGLNWSLAGSRTDVADVEHEHDLTTRAK
jgi:hypothetical protein